MGFNLVLEPKKKVTNHLLQMVRTMQSLAVWETSGRAKAKRKFGGA
jgi:hypothetical protein